MNSSPLFYITVANFQHLQTNLWESNNCSHHNDVTVLLSLLLLPSLMNFASHETDVNLSSSLNLVGSTHCAISEPGRLNSLCHLWTWSAQLTVPSLNLVGSTHCAISEPGGLNSLCHLWTWWAQFTVPSLNLVGSTHCAISEPGGLNSLCLCHETKDW